MTAGNCVDVDAEYLEAGLDHGVGGMTAGVLAMTAPIAGASRAADEPEREAMTAKDAALREFDGHVVIEMWRPNTDAWALRGHLDSVAATIIDGETASRLRQERLAGSRSREERGRMTAGLLPSTTVVILCWHICLISESMGHHDLEIMDDRSID